MKAKFISLTLMVAVCLASVVAAQDSLPSRSDTAAKRTIVAPVERVTKEGSPDFVKSEARKPDCNNYWLVIWKNAEVASA